MTLPIDLVLVRHGQSEGNKAKRLAEKGDDSAYERLIKRHTASYRLSNLGIQQAQLARDWIRQEFYFRGKIFDRYFVSDYFRAMETAGLLDLPNAEWFRNFYLTERDWGDLDRYNGQERMERFRETLEHRDVEPFFWSPPNGESFAALCLRLEKILETLHREAYDKRVIIVCHGEVMWAWRVLLERMPQEKFRELHLSQNPIHRIHNCEIFHYTRRNPQTRKQAPHANWMRRIRPTENPIWVSEWEEITRPRYSSEDLLRIVSETERIID